MFAIDVKSIHLDLAREFVLHLDNNENLAENQNQFKKKLKT